MTAPTLDHASLKLILKSHPTLDHASLKLILKTTLAHCTPSFKWYLDSFSWSYMKVCIVDTNTQFIEEARKEFGELEISCCSVTDIPTHGRAFVSPSNSLLFMDGGIDAVYSRTMFPGVEATLRKKVLDLGFRTRLGRPYLPVGSAIATIVEGCNGCSCVIAAPTMFLPHDVSRTRNAYHAFMAALLMFEKMRRSEPRLHTLVTPALCTGYGKMEVREAARQMHEAYVDFMAVKVPAQVSHLDLPWSFVTANRDHEQPVNFDNREIRDIDIRLL